MYGIGRMFLIILPKGNGPQILVNIKARSSSYLFSCYCHILHIGVNMLSYLNTCDMIAIVKLNIIVTAAYSIPKGKPFVNIARVIYEMQ